MRNRKIYLGFNQGKKYLNNKKTKEEVMKCI